MSAAGEDTPEDVRCNIIAKRSSKTVGTCCIGDQLERKRAIHLSSSQRKKIYT